MSRPSEEGIKVADCLGCSHQYPLEDMNKYGLCEECQYYTAKCEPLPTKIGDEKMSETEIEIKNWIENFELTSQNVGDLEQQFEDLLREQTDQRIRESEGLDWESIATITARLLVDMGYTCASLIEGYGDEE